MLLGVLLRQSIQKLKAAENPRAEYEAAWIIGAILNRNAAQLEAEGARALSESEQAQIEAAIALCADHKSIPRIFGRKRFCGLEIMLEDGVFEPFQESEFMVAHALAALPDHAAPLRVLDLGAGSGNLLLALLKALPQATGLGIDRNAKAIDLAKRNAAHNRLALRALFQVGDFTQPINDHFDVAIANFPFARSGAIKAMSPGTVKHEPVDALDGGNDGLRFYRHMAKVFSQVVKPGGIGVFQLGAANAQAVQRLFAWAGYRHSAIQCSPTLEPVCLLVRQERQQSLWGWVKKS